MDPTRDTTGATVPGTVVHEDLPRYATWFKLVIAGTLLLTVVLGIVLFPVSPAGALVCLGVTVFDALLFHAVIPRKYQIFPDRLRIVLGRPFALNVALDTITEAREAGGGLALAYFGHRFAPSTETVVEIVRSRGLNVVISPDRRELFLDRLREALDTAQRSPLVP